MFSCVSVCCCMEIIIKTERDRSVLHCFPLLGGIVEFIYFPEWLIKCVVCVSVRRTRRCLNKARFAETQCRGVLNAEISFAP